MSANVSIIPVAPVVEIMRAAQLVEVAAIATVAEVVTLGFDEVATVAGSPDGAEALAGLEIKNTAATAMMMSREATTALDVNFMM